MDSFGCPLHARIRAGKVSDASYHERPFAEYYQPACYPEKRHLKFHCKPLGKIARIRLWLLNVIKAIKTPPPSVIKSASIEPPIK
jgi:hypothetical protein